MNRAAAAAVFLFCGFLFVHNAAPSATTGDSGEFVTAAATLSLPHAPGYPLFSLAGKAFSVAVPWGHPGYRLNLFSAFLNAGSAALLWFLVRALLGAGAGAAAFGALLLAGLPAFFHNGLVTEVFALNSFWALLLAAVIVRFPTPRGALAGSFLLGLGLGNHQTLVLAVPAFLLLAWDAGGRRSFRPWALGLAFAAGFSIYLFLLMRSRTHPPLDWGDPETFSRLWRTITRKDYGSFSLALGDAPERGAAVALKQLARYGRGTLDQFTWVGLLLAAGGLAALWSRRRGLALALAAGWFFTGPFFFWFGNLPFDPQSDGILERFYILPALFLAVAAAAGCQALSRRRWGTVLCLALPAFLLVRSARAFQLRADFLVEDYGVNILRGLPPASAFFMDGGDDTFYSMAFQRFVRRKRQDVEMFDRGGLIFRNPYGPGFRALDREGKAARRAEVENSWRRRGALVYSTMEERILPGVKLAPAGFLYHAIVAPAVPFWDFYVFRSLHPPASDEYRTRALAPYFPFQRARASFAAGRRAEAFLLLRRSWRMGEGVPWLTGNLTTQALAFGYESFKAEDIPHAEKFFRLALEASPSNVDALVNLGAAAERQGRLDEAAAHYERAIRIDPRSAGALYNLSVVYWRQQRWDKVVPLLEAVLALDPNHAAARYLPAARERAAGGKRAR